MIATVRKWAAWAPGCATAEDWRRWAAKPHPLGREGAPDARFLPALLRRRCSALSRVTLTVAFASCDEQDLPNIRTVFASRHGNVNESVDLLEAVARTERVSAARFSHTVHNAQAGLFSIAAGNRSASTSVSATEETFALAYVEALTHLDREPAKPVLLVMSDVPISPTFARFVDEPSCAYGLGLLLATGGEGQKLQLARAEHPTTETKHPWPDALEFLRWLLSDETEITLGPSQGPSRHWRWTKVS